MLIVDRCLSMLSEFRLTSLPKWLLSVHRIGNSNVNNDIFIDQNELLSLHECYHGARVIEASLQLPAMRITLLSPMAWSHLTQFVICRCVCALIYIINEWHLIL